MYKRISEKNVPTNKLAKVIEIAASAREGLLIPGGLPEHDWWADQAIKNFTEIIIRANFVAQTILNPEIVMDDVESQVSKALKQAARRIKQNKKLR